MPWAATVISAAFAKPWFLPPFYVWTLLRTGVDVARVDVDGMAGGKRRQRERLARIVEFARQHSGYYHDLFKHVPTGVTDVTLLPVSKKPDLMASFDGWVTDHAITKPAVEAFVADQQRIGELFLGKY